MNQKFLFTLILASSAFTFFSFTSANKKQLLSISTMDNYEQRLLTNEKNFTGSLVFTNSYSHFKRTTTINFSVDDYDDFKKLSTGNLAIQKNYNNNEFITKVAVSKKIKNADTTSAAYKQVDAILKKYE